jgi:hypothetical protein
MASKKKTRANNHKNKSQSTAGVRGVIRKEHFEEGGSLATWRGTSAIHKNHRDKRNDRSTQRRKAIRDSQED